MKRFYLIAGVIVGILIVFIGLIGLRLRVDRPEYLIDSLRHVQGADRQKLVMRLSLARGDVTGKLIEAFNRSTADPSFRAQLLELLFKQNLRTPDERQEPVVLRALKDPAPEVRRAAAYGLVAYGEQKAQRLLAGCVGDADAQVRRQVYSLFAAADPRPDRRGVYGILTDTERRQLVAACAAQMKTEADPDAAFLAKAVVGLEISVRCEDAVQALGSADLPKARELMESALALDPENKQAQVRLARLYLATGDPKTAVATARRYGALIEAPRLSKAPVIDGDPSDEVWREGFTTDTFYHTTSPFVAKLTTGKSRCHFGYRDGRLYVAMLGFEEDLDKLVVRKKNRDDNVWQDDCVELVFSPENSEKDYFQFVINPAGALHDIKSGDNSGNYSCEYKAGIFKDRGYWAVEFAIDAKELTSNPITRDTIWSLDFFRARIGPASEHGCIWPTYGGTLFPGRYPLVVFKDAP